MLKDGPLKIKATTTGPSSTIAKIVRMVGILFSLDNKETKRSFFFSTKRSFYNTCIVLEQVEDAQAREAPVQRLADSIAGPFVYTVMTLSAATFSFWYAPILLFVVVFPFQKEYT